MAKLDYEKDFNDLIQTLEDFPDLVEAIALDAMRDAMLFVLGEIPPYPPEHPGQRYRRTQRLGQSYTSDVRRNQDVIDGEVGTNVEYAPWVVGDTYPGDVIDGRRMYQRDLFKERGWYRLHDVLDDSMEGARDEFFETMIKKVKQHFENGA